MKNAVVALLLISVLTFSCASTHPGEMGTFIKGQQNSSVLISAQEVKDFSDDHYTFLTFTVENKSDDMLHIKSTDLDFDSPAELRANVLVGQDLAAWADAHEEEMKKAQQNKKAAQLGVILGGAALAIVGVHNQSKALAGVGETAMAGGAAWAIGSEIHKSAQNAENPKQVPENHVYAPFSVPAGKFVRKWAVIQHAKDAELGKVYFNLVLDDGSEATYAILVR